MGGRDDEDVEDDVVVVDGDVVVVVVVVVVAVVVVFVAVVVVVIIVVVVVNLHQYVQSVNQLRSRRSKRTTKVAICLSVNQVLCDLDPLPGPKISNTQYAAEKMV